MLFFEETQFPYATASCSSVPSSEASSTSFPQAEPAILNDHMRNYDLSLLLANEFHADTTPTSLPHSQVSLPCVSTTPTHQVSQDAATPLTATEVTSELPSPSPPEVLPETPPTSPTSPASTVLSPVREAPADQSLTTPTMTTRGRAGKVFPLKFTDGTFCYDLTKRAFSVTTPTSFRVALSSPDWRAAMKAEFAALQSNKMWTLVPRPTGVNIVGCK